MLKRDGNFCSQMAAAFLVSLLLTNAAHAAEEHSSGAATEAPADTSSPPASTVRTPAPLLPIRCVFVLDREFLDGLGLDEPSVEARIKPDANDIQQLRSCPKDKPEITTSGTLTGVGDLQVVVARQAYDQILAENKQADRILGLFINGVALSGDAPLIAVEHLNDDVYLHFRVDTGERSQTLWAMLYRSGALTDLQPLRVGLGWETVRTPAHVTDQVMKIAVTNTLKEILATALVILMLVFMYYVGARTDVLRDAATREANRKRATFSLGRVQLAAWFMFAVGAGVFMWIVYGELPAIDGSLLALLGLSVATTGVSMAVDHNSGGREFIESQGFFTDLVTGFDHKQQVHRYQAVIVNILLLAVGVAHVVQQLTYPIFESTWLALLGISGVTFGAGKQLIEAPKEETPDKQLTTTTAGEGAKA